MGLNKHQSNLIKTMTKATAKCYLDSNVLIYAKDETSLKYREACNLITGLVANDTELYISPLCLDEFLHEFGKKLRLKKNQKLFFSDLEKSLSSILEFPLLSVINPPQDSSSQLEIVNFMKNYLLRPRDAYHLLTMLANNIDSFATFDADFKKVFVAKLVNRA